MGNSDNSTSAEELFCESCLNDEKENRYVTQDGKTVLSNDNKTISWNFIRRLKLFLYEVFLPRGYPDSVSEDYIWYQTWDTLQACCSTFCGMLAVQAVLLGVGVGRDTATPLAAALAWFTKDGVGMVSGIAFAWLKGTSLDSECKKWRLFADGINDLAFCIELSIAAFQDSAVILLCVSSALKSIVGVAGGATRAALTHHQATRGNTADVAAKDGSQETLVNLITMSVGIWVINKQIVQQNIWIVMGMLIILHLYCNFRAVKALRLRKFNEERYLTVLRDYLLYGRVPSVEEVNTQESVILGCGASAQNLTGYSISIGESLKRCLQNAESLVDLLKEYRDHSYIIIPNENQKKIWIALKSFVDDNQMLQAYFHGFSLALLKSLPDNPPEGCPLSRLKKEVLKDGIPVAVIDKKFADFSASCRTAGWNLQEHVLRVGQWRINQDVQKKTN